MVFTNVIAQNALNGNDFSQIVIADVDGEKQFEVLDDRERLARSAAARLEAGLVRRFMDFDKHS